MEGPNGRARRKFLPWDQQDLLAVWPLVQKTLKAERPERALKRALRGLSAQERAACAEAVLEICANERLIDDLASYIRFRSGQVDLSAYSRAERYSVPDFFDERLERGRGGAFCEAFYRAVSRPGPVVVRARDRAVAAQILEQDGVSSRPLEDFPWALEIWREDSPQVNPTITRAWREGHIEVQDAGSQEIARFTLESDGHILDFCAGRGGKSLALSAAGREVLASDIDDAREVDLRARAQRAQLTISWASKAELKGREFPVILVDAPCTESGTLRRSVSLRRRLNEGALERAVHLQRGVLDEALTHLSPGGTLVYATCSVLHEENEDQRDFLLTRGLSLDEERLLTPHEHDTDGFYMARFKSPTS